MFRSLEPLMADIRAQIGDHPCYLSFDIDAIDPGFCPGTGTPEIGGLTSIQALEIIRSVRQCLNMSQNVSICLIVSQYDGHHCQGLLWPQHCGL